MHDMQPAGMLCWGAGMLSQPAAGLEGPNVAALTAAACCLLARPLAATLPAAGARSMFWFARCVFAEMLGSHAIMFVVRGAGPASACPRLHTHVWAASPPGGGQGTLSCGCRLKRDHRAWRAQSSVMPGPLRPPLCLACCVPYAESCASVALSAFVR